MKPIHTRLIVLLGVASSIVGGAVMYGNYTLDQENTRLMIAILSDSQSQAAELTGAIQELQRAQQQLQRQFRAWQTNARGRQSGAPGQRRAGIPTMQNQAAVLQVSALDSHARDVVDLRPDGASERSDGFSRAHPDNYWQALQRYVAENEYFQLNPQEKQRFLEEGAALVQQLEKIESHYRIDSESVQFIEARMGEEGIDAIEQLYTVKKQLAGYVTEGKQYRRELDAMLQETSSSELPKITHQSPRRQGRTSEYYHPALADNWVLCDETGNFLIALRFVYKTQVGGFPKIANVEDTINLRTMQSINGSYRYPEYFIEEIYSLVRKNFRDGFIKFHGMTRKDEQLQYFLSLIR